MSAPTVSIVIPTYNRADVLGRAIDSVIAQWFDDWELIVVDDGSTDETAKRLTEYATRLGPRLRVIHQKNAGASAARNRGIDAAQGEFVAFLDSDDEFLPEKLQKQIDCFRRRPDLGLVFSDYAYVDLTGTRRESVLADFCPRLSLVSMTPMCTVERASTPAPVGRASPPGTVERASVPVADDRIYVCGPNLFDVMLGGYLISTITGTVRRDILNGAPSDLLSATDVPACNSGPGVPARSSGPGVPARRAGPIRFPENCAYAEEWLFYLQFARTCRAGFIDEPLCLHHHAQGSLSRRDRTSNAHQLLRLLHTMRTTLAPLSRHQDRVIRRQIAAAAAQIGYDAAKQGRYAAAARRFAQSIRHHARAAIVGPLIESAVRAGLSPARSAKDPPWPMGSPPAHADAPAAPANKAEPGAVR